jgi:hypothetical protein
MPTTQCTTQTADFYSFKQVVNVYIKNISMCDLVIKIKIVFEVARYGMIYFEILCTFPIQDDLVYSSVTLIPRSSIDV